MYVYMSVYRSVPIPYSHFASLFYNYHRLGTSYRSTGLAIGITSVLHIVAGLLTFCGSLLAGVSIVFNNYVLITVVGSGLIALTLHPAIFTRLIQLRSSSEQQAEIPPITWQTTLLLVTLNVIVLLFGGGALYFAALMIMDAPLLLLPVCIGTWGLLVSTLNMLAWLPADFGATRAIFVLLLQQYMPVAMVTALFATWRIGMIVLDLGNAGIVLLVRTFWQKRTGDYLFDKDENE
jgi:hypothetical protein